MKATLPRQKKFPSSKAGAIAKANHILPSIPGPYAMSTPITLMGSPGNYGGSGSTDGALSMLAHYFNERHVNGAYLRNMKLVQRSSKCWLSHQDFKVLYELSRPLEFFSPPRQVYNSFLNLRKTSPWLLKELLNSISKKKLVSLLENSEKYMDNFQRSNCYDFLMCL